MIDSDRTARRSFPRKRQCKIAPRSVAEIVPRVTAFAGASGSRRIGADGASAGHRKI
jgi:hypothetical protein